MEMELAAVSFNTVHFHMTAFYFIPHKEEVRLSQVCELMSVPCKNTAAATTGR